MDTNLGDALSGLLHLSSNSNNYSDDGSMTHITNDSNVSPTSSNGGSTSISNACSMDATPTPPATEMKRRKYKKIGNTSFRQHKESKKSKVTNKATLVAKQSANAAISASMNETSRIRMTHLRTMAARMKMTPLRMKV